MSRRIDLAQREANLAKVPSYAASTLPSTGEPVLIQRGIVGYFPARPDLDVAAFNATHGVTPAIQKAMEMGSMFGWDVPGADPDHYRDLNVEVTL